MIHGCFYHDKGDVSLISAIMENCSTLDQSREKDRVHLYCNDTLTGLTVGNNGNRSLFSSHTGVCGGVLCECRKAATTFLSGTGESGLDMYVKNNKINLMEKLSAPFLLILMEGNESVIISSYGAGDFDCKRIEAHTSSIRYKLSDQHFPIIAQSNTNFSTFLGIALRFLRQVPPLL
jgi:hypothetical protein